jgi:RimJ/RimL family protein N-acetyltransferase
MIETERLSSAPEVARYQSGDTTYALAGEWVQLAAVDDDRNVAVHQLFERLGFRCEARLLEADWFKGEWTTLRVHALLRREWASRR